MASKIDLSKLSLRTFFKGDKVLYVCIIALMLVSVCVIYSATSVLAYQRGGGDTLRYVLSHSIKLLLGLMVLGLASCIHPRRYAGFAEVGLIFGIGLLILTMIVGTNINGASRWLSLGFFSFQPSEVAKIALIIFVAKTLSRNEQDPDRAFWPCMFFTGVVCGIILFENLSTSLLTGASVLVLLWIGRVSWYKLFAVVTLCASLVVAIVFFAPVVGKVLPRTATWNARIERFLDNDSGQQAEHALTAVSTGGMLGRGPGNSYMKNFLPMAYSDFIYSIILEEWGLFGGLFIIAAYFTIFARARVIAMRCRRSFHLYTIVGLAVLISLQVLIHMCVCVGLIPVTGQTLPMISMGGTSNVIMGGAFGIMLSISHYAEHDGNVNML